MSLLKRFGRSCGRSIPLIVVEHLEDHVSSWLAVEYRHILAFTGGCMAVTNAGRFCDKIASIVGSEHCFRESILELGGVLYTSPEKVIVLDMRAEEKLEPPEARSAEAIVVGGILGDHPPRGRTWELLTRRAIAAGMTARNIGREQFSIDGAAYVALEVARGRRVESIPVTVSPTLPVELGDGFIWEVTLPFAYPLVNGKPLYAPGLIELLRRGLAYEEYRESRWRG